MIGDVNSALTRLVHERGLVPPDDVDIEFDPPVRSWVGGRTRPTLNFFLFDIEENTELRSTQAQTTRGNGVAVRRIAPRRFDLRYMVSAITTVVEDEHLLLWRTLVTLMKHPTLPESLLPESVTSYGLPVAAKVLKHEDAPRALDIWGALETPPRPALIYVVTLPVDLDLTFTAPLVLTRTARYARLRDGVSIEQGVHIGGTVRDRKGRPLVGARVSAEGRAFETTTGSEGEFVLPDVDAGPVTLRVLRDGRPEKRVTFEIPSDQYEIVVD